MSTAPSSSTVKSAMRTLDLLEYVVARPGGVVAQEISAALAIPVSSLSYLLATMVEREYLRREGRKYLAGVRLDRLRGPRPDETLVERAHPFVTALRNRLNETASLFERREWKMVAMVTETGDQTLRYSIEVGTFIPLHCVAAGKALLAEMPPEEFDRYLAETERERFTPHTITDRAALSDEIASIRETGIATTRDEMTLGISGIGVAIGGFGGTSATIGVAIPTPRLSDAVLQDAMEQVMRTAQSLRRALAQD
ncbi:IclR family transcriptional regulator [Sphingomonas sp.]|uniref:IclR family transcriptional regulator n=1 Tax=Sphingomonas sp. TaxID=28214 RepID=UPI0031DB1D69